MTPATADSPTKRAKRQGNPLLQVRIPDAELELLRERAQAMGYPSLSAAARFLLRENLLRGFDPDGPHAVEAQRALYAKRAVKRRGR